MRTLFFVFSVLLYVASSGQKGASVSFEKWLSLKGAGNPVIAPDGKTIVYTVTSTDWVNNAYDSELWMAKSDGPPIQLTRTVKGSSFGARFTPDSRYISFLADRGDKTQLYLISVEGGEALQLTREEEGISSYEWSPDGRWVAFVKPDRDTKKEKALKDRYGAFGVEGEEFKQNHLWLLPFSFDSIQLAAQMPCFVQDSAKLDSLRKRGECISLPTAKRLTEGNYSVQRFLWNPDGKSIGFVRQPDPLINSSEHADIAKVDIGSKMVTLLVSHPSVDVLSAWSPDGRSFLYQTYGTDTVSYYFRNARFYIYTPETKKETEVLADIDENKNVLDWNSSGIYFISYDKTRQRLYRLDPATGKSKAVDLPLPLVNGASFSKTGVMVVSGRNYEDLNEVYVLRAGQALKKITGSTAQISGWNTPVNEVISWKSRDGAAIEGVLLKPRNFVAGKKYPLLVVIHGGPTGIDLPDPTPTYVYPIMQWVEKGALVLRVNYRGSAGYGERFRSLNVRNLGVGDMWDVLSGIDHLKSRGMIDTTRMGCMGWSQGGYISAFLTTNTHIFKAISVGAGISNWVTYYVNTDITPFTRHYLQATPWSDMEVYLKTSPMTQIGQASTPTLIQHGELDKRVPVPNAYELYRGLQDRGVPSRLIIYKGFGHVINKPKERLAAVWHNWNWFNTYVFGEKEEGMGEEI